MTKLLIVSALIVVVLIICTYMYDNSCENMTVESNEAIQDVGAVYNKNNMTVTNVNVTDTLGANVVNTNALNSNGCDLAIGKGCSRGDCKACRALVKDDGNVLTINYGNDFAGGTRVSSDLNVTGTATVNRLYSSGAVNAPNGWQSHFPFVDNNGVHENYIRGDTVVDGKIFMGDGRRIVSKRDNIRCAWSCCEPPSFKMVAVNSADECRDYCINNYGINTLVADFEKNTKNCRCKTSLQDCVYDTNHTAVFTL